MNFHKYKLKILLAKLDSNSNLSLASLEKISCSFYIRSKIMNEAQIFVHTFEKPIEKLVDVLPTANKATRSPKTT